MERVEVVLGMSAAVLRANALRLPLADESVDLICTSPPFFALRSYRDEGEHYSGQLGSEETPQAFLEALWAVTAECWRVLKPSGSMWVNLGDKYAGSSGTNNNGSQGSTLNIGPNPGTTRTVATQAAPVRVVTDVRPKSLMGLPWRYAIGCIDGEAAPDGQRWILRAEVIWSKPNGLPESVTDRVRRSHEQWFHFVKSPRYFSAVDEVREVATTPASGDKGYPNESGNGLTHRSFNANAFNNPLGKLPGSVWQIPSEPLIIPEAVQRHYELPDHFAAFPQELPRRIILGWSPSGICVECGEGRRPVKGVTDGQTTLRRILTSTEINEWVQRFAAWCRERGISRRRLAEVSGTADMGARWLGVGGMGAVPNAGHWSLLRGEWPDLPEWLDEYVFSLREVPTRNRYAQQQDGGTERYGGGTAPPVVQTITGYACACPDASAPTKPSVILDCFGGTGTTAMVARTLGRFGVSVDLSADYNRLAKWRIFESGHGEKAAQRTHRENQGDLFGNAPAYGDVEVGEAL